MNKKRILRLQEQMRADGVDGVLYATSSNMQYFLDDTSYAWQRTPYTGFAIPGPNGHQLNVPDCVLYIPTEDEPVLFLSYIRERDMQQLPVQKILDGYPEINYLKTEGDYVEILKKGVDKGTGLLKLAEMLGCGKKDTYAAGDGYNDVEMLLAANGGFVPENGSREALSVAKYVTRSNNNGCIAHAIEILDGIY